MKINKYKVYKIGPAYFFWNGKLIIGHCNKIFQGGYDVTFGVINKNILRFRVDYENPITEPSSLSKTLNTIREVFKTVLNKQNTICVTTYSFSRDRYKYERQCLKGAISSHVRFSMMDKEIHKFELTAIAYNVDHLPEVKEGLSNQEWFNGPEENRKKFETL